MKKNIALYILTIALLGLTAQGSAVRADFDQEIRPLLDQYCFQCHGTGKRVKGGVNLAEFTNLASIHRDPKTWETALRVVEDREMPPEDKNQPSEMERERLVSWMRHTLDNPDDRVVPKDPGRVVLHRLSGTEYNNTIRDLFGVNSNPAEKFPSEGGGGGGFDNNADTLFIPPILMERYLESAHAVMEEATPERLLIVRPGSALTEREAARQIVEYYAFRAFRRPTAPEEIDRYLALFDRTGAQDLTFAGRIKTTLAALLVSPHFLYRVELDQPTDAPYRINDYELASRLSYFLWSSMPDPQLFRLAGEGRLHKPKILAHQVARMLQDPKSRMLAEKFAGQWLGIDKLDTAAQPDPNRFESYTVELRDAMKREPLEMFQFVARENRSLLELLDADYTFVNGSLAEHYGIEGVSGEDFQKVALTDRNRGGVLGMGAILTLTSYPLRTSPVLRGKWVLEEILGTPPPPPPPLVKSLPRDDRPRQGLTFRQRLEKHREDPNCAACHKKMDPLGFGLENFDAIGRWRTEIAKDPVDASGELPTGETFDGPAELKRILLARKDLFVRNITERMLAYALGRGLEYYDVPVVKDIVAKLEDSGYASRTLILEIVKSFPFQYRRNQPIDAGEDLARRDP